MKEEIQTYNQDRPFLSIGEASDYLGISKATLYHYTHHRILKHYKVRGKKIYFLKADLDDFIMNESNIVKSNKQIEGDALAIVRELDL